jgi:Fic family protein
MLETPQRIEPARLDDVPQALSDLVAEISAAAAKLETALNPRTAASLAQLVRIMNSYYSNLIEGNTTKPREIERAIIADLPFSSEAMPETTPAEVQPALSGNLEGASPKRALLLETVAHVHLQAQIDKLATDNKLPEPASGEFIKWLHCEFYRDAPAETLRITSKEQTLVMAPGAWRSLPEHNVSVGRHQPPASERVAEFMGYFTQRYTVDRLGKAARILAIPAAHHRFNYIHPFLDGNGRVSRLMSHAMAHSAGIGAHGLWSVSRGLARGLDSRTDYKCMMDYADTPRQGDLDGRGNLSQKALVKLTEWFLGTCLDQITFMSSLFEINTLARRLKSYVEKSESLKPEASRLLEEALVRGEFERGEAERITGLPERTARRVLNDVTRIGLLASDTPKGPVSLRFPVETQDILFPRLFAES